MTPQTLEIVRLKAQIHALQVLVRTLFVGVGMQSSTAADGVRQHFAALRAQHAQIALEHIDPAESDMVAAEFQEAVDDLLRFIEEGLPK